MLISLALSPLVSKLLCTTVFKWSTASIKWAVQSLHKLLICSLSGNLNSLASPLFQHLRHPKLDTRIPFVCSSFVLRHAQGTPPEIWNGLDWRALVKSRAPNIGKLRGWHFFCYQKKIEKKWVFEIFWDFHISETGLTG